MSEQELRDYLEKASKSEAIEIALQLLADAVRLREELDKLKGVYR